MKNKILYISLAQIGYGMGYHYQIEVISEYFDVDFLCFDAGKKKIDNKCTNVFYYFFNKLENKFIRNIKFAIEAIKLSRKNNYNAVIVTQGYLDLLIGFFIHSKYKIRDIRTGFLYDNKLKRYLSNLILIRIACLPYDKITVLSENLIPFLKLPRKKTVVVPQGSIPICKEHDNKVEGISLVYLGTLHKRRIHETVEGIYKFLQIVEYKMPIKYNIIGSGSQEDEALLLEFVNKYKLENVVTFHGYKSHSEIEEIFKNSNVGVAYVPNTEYYQYQPATKVIEYALSGLITIATDTYANKRFINSKNGILCKDNCESFAEALLKVSKILDDFNSEIVINSLSEYHWHLVTKKYWIPILKTI